ncbi:MAG: subtilase family serine protease, partial [Algoriphagus marincola HL-49]
IEKFAVPGDVVMMSLGESGVVNCQNSEPFLRDIILDLGEKGIFVVMSAGNEGQSAGSNLPGCISGKNVFTVGSVDFSETGFLSCSGFSNAGAPPIDWLAPGANLVSTFPGNAYNVMSGTSMACALVAGLIHSNGGPPRAIQQINCGGATYSVAGR